MDTTSRGGRPKVVRSTCDSPGCSRPGRTRFPAPTRAYPDPPTYCDACRKRLERSLALECSQQGCRRLRQWNKLKAERKRFCREHERVYLEDNPVAVRRALETIVQKVEVTRGFWVRRLTPKPLEAGARPQVHVGYPWKVYRFLYVLIVGPLGNGVTLDHLCSHRDCVAVHHLEAVSSVENKRRQGQRTRQQRSRARDVEDRALELLADPQVNHALLRMFLDVSPRCQGPLS